MVCLGRRMHQLFFSIKRVHWMWQGKARRILNEELEAPITPAQYNMLRTLYTYRYGIVRFKLAQVLGVAPPGVSRMVKLLERKGLVFRSRYDTDRRCVCVKLTDEGTEFVEDILGIEYREQLATEELWVDSRVEREVCEWFASTERHEIELAILDQFLIRARVRQDDPAIYPFPWHGGEVNWGQPGTIQEPPPTRFRVAA